MLESLYKICPSSNGGRGGGVSCRDQWLYLLRSFYTDPGSQLQDFFLTKFQALSAILWLVLCRKSGKIIVWVILALKAIKYCKHSYVSYVRACILKGAVKSFLKSLVLQAVTCVTQKWVPLAYIIVAVSGNKHRWKMFFPFSAL